MGELKRLRGRPAENRRGKQTTMFLYPRDIEMADSLARHFGSSRSDVIRTAVRTMYVNLGLGKPE